jgi:2-dehydro-3-deoxygluconokinase
MNRVVAFGEIMMRLATPGHLRFIQSNTLELTYGGGEANVAVSLAQFGIDAAFVSRLPDNDLAQAAINHLRGFGVDTRHVLRGGDRMGIYFLESGASQRASSVTYDRHHSAISEITPSDLDWNTILEGASWLHLTGITPALSPHAAQATLEAARTARAKGVTVCLDWNYRAKLWSPEQARENFTELMEHTDYCIANREDAAKLFGLRPENGSDVNPHADVARQLSERFGFKGVAMTIRESFSASRNAWSALYFTGGQSNLSKRYDIQIVDRVGGGDSFAAGLIYGLVKQMSPAEVIEFAVAASCLKHTISGDFNLVTLAEVNAFLASDGSGRVLR